jgi:hypothetical protein
VDAAHVRAFDAMTPEELAGMWCSLLHLGVNEGAADSRAAEAYFAHLRLNVPERAFALVLAVLRSGADKSLLMTLNQSLFFPALLKEHGTALLDRIIAEARHDARLRWLLSGANWWVSRQNLSVQLTSEADRTAWRADALPRPGGVIDFTCLTAVELGRVWVELNSNPGKHEDKNWYRLKDYEDDLLGHEPDRTLDAILEILRIETDEELLGLLAATLLECVISFETIDRIEREAAANDKFRWLLGGVWYWTEPDELKARLDAIVQGQHWEN